MSYTVNLDRNSTITIPDEVILQDGGESQLPITLFGKNTAYGETLQCSMYHLLETFYSNHIPYSPVAGMLWFDGTELRVNTGGEYQWMKVELNTNVGPIPAGAHYSTVLSGKPKFGSTLTATITNPNLTFTTQWYVDGALDTTNTTTTYVTTNSQVGKTIRARCLVVNSQQIAEFSDSNTITISTVNPATNFNVTVSGTNTVQQTLTSSTTTPVYDDGTTVAGPFTILWQKDGVAITGEVTNTYITKLTDAGYRINAKYSFTDLGSVVQSSISNDINVSKIPLTWTSTLSLSGGKISGKLIAVSTYPIFLSLSRRDTIDFSVDNLPVDITPICTGSADKKTLTFVFDGTSSDTFNNINVRLYDDIFSSGLKSINIDPIEKSINF